MSTIPYHQLYSIHILVIIPRGVVDALCPVVSLSFMLAVCFPYFPAALRFFYPLELGRRLRCQKQTARVSRLLSFSTL